MLLHVFQSKGKIMSRIYYTTSYGIKLLVAHELHIVQLCPLSLKVYGNAKVLGFCNLLLP